MRYTIAIPTYNRAETLKAALVDYTLHMPKNVSLVVVDNGSTDKTPLYLDAVHGKRIHTILEPGHVKTAFLEALHAASLTSDYTILMSDEDSINWDQLDQLTAWLNQYQPVFASTKFTHSEGFVRGRQHGTITADDWFASAFYCSGLIYRSDTVWDAIDWTEPKVLSNDFIDIYAEAVLALHAYTTDDPVLWAPFTIARQREQLPTYITMSDGTPYWKPDNRKKLATAYDQLLTRLNEDYAEKKHRWDAARKDKLIKTWR